MMPPKAVDAVEPRNQDVQKVSTNNIGSNLANFTSDELGVISHILVAILHASDFKDLLEEIHQALNRLLYVSGCAIYRVSDHGRGLQIAFQTGDCRSYLPDLIPQGSGLFTSIANRKLVDVNTSARCHQPSLFDDHPISMFGPLVVDDHLVGALSVVHRIADAHFVSTILNEAVIALELLCKADTFTNSLSMRAHFGQEARIKREETRDDGYSKLTPREKEVLTLLGHGLSNKELADRLYISSATCKHHVESILTKLHLHNRAAAVAVALAHPHN